MGCWIKIGLQGWLMSLHLTPFGEIPNETVRVAKAACPKGTLATRLRDEFADLYQDADFAALYPVGPEQLPTH